MVPRFIMINILDIPHDKRAVFIERLNRFLGVAEIDGQRVNVHIHDPGRLPEILYPGNSVLLRRSARQKRKTKWDVLAGLVDKRWVFVHSGYHRAITEKILLNESISPFGAVSELDAEVRYKTSRLDFRLKLSIGDIVWLEVKGCTLAKNGVALFPDAPTTRGRRHIEELIKLKEDGYRAAVLFLVMRADARCFAPNQSMDPEFAKSFKQAVEKGVEIYPIKMDYDGEKIWYKVCVPLCETLERT